MAPTSATAARLASTWACAWSATAAITCPR
jgi:hypothetical protein